MIVAVVAMRMMQVAVDEIVYVITMWNLRMAAIGPVNVSHRVAAAVMIRRTSIGIDRSHGQYTLINVVAMCVMQMAVVQIVNVAVVLDREMTTAGAVRVLVFRHFGASRHDRSPCRGDHLS